MKMQLKVAENTIKLKTQVFTSMLYHSSLNLLGIVGDESLIDAGQLTKQTSNFVGYATSSDCFFTIGE